jgi:hypothetical protein
MRHLKKFESFKFRMSEDVDHEYIRNCFADFIDAGAHVSIDGNLFQMTAKLPADLDQIKYIGIVGDGLEYVSDENSKMRKILAGHDLNNEFYKEIGRAFDRLADEYPYLRMRMTAGDSSVSITIARG